MQIHITRNGQSFGPYTLDQVSTLLASGQLKPDDLAWHEGAPQWMPLSQVQGVIAQSNISTPTASRATTPPPITPPPPTASPTPPAPSGGWPVPPTTPPPMASPPSSSASKEPILSDHVKGFAAGVQADAVGRTPQEMLRKYVWHIVGACFGLFLIARFAQAVLSLLVLGLLVCLIVGLFKPQTFRFVFGARTSKARVGWTFGAALLVIGAIGSSLEPKPATDSPSATAPASPAPASPIAPAQNQPPVAPARKVVAPARANNPKRAAPKPTGASSGDVAPSDGELRDGEPTESESRLSGSQARPATEEALPNNVSEITIKGVGKRQVGVVDQVEYAVLNVERMASIGSTNAGGTFYLLHVVASNTDKKTHTIITSIMKLLDDQEREFDPSSEGSTALMMEGDQSAQLFATEVQPGVIKRFTLVYDAPGDAAGLKLKVPSGSFSLSPDAVIALPK